MIHFKEQRSDFSKNAFAWQVAVIMFLTICLWNMQNVQAQETKTDKHSGQSLQIFDGFYQSNENENAFLHITPRGHNLVLKQMWDGKEFTFDQTAPLEFYNKDASFPLKFTDSAGVITQVLAFNRDVWNKTKAYNAPATKAIHLSPAELKSFEGKYKFKDGDADDILQITSDGNNLILKQVWDGQIISFVPVSSLEFYCASKLFPLKFSKDNNGNVTQVLAFNKDLWLKMKE